MADLLIPAIPADVIAELTEDGDLSVVWDKVTGAASYVIHYGDANVSDPKQATHLGYSETNAWALKAADVPKHTADDAIYVYVQAFGVTGTGETDADKAEQLTTATDIKGTEWSEPAIAGKLPVIHVTGVQLSQTYVYVDPGNTVQFTQIVLPDNATDKSGKWSTSDTSLATVSGGLVTVKDNVTGEFDVVFTANDGDVAGTAHVVINQPVPPRLSYTVQRGDDIATVATSHGVSVGWVRYVNRLAGLRLTVGRVLFFDLEE